MNILICNITNGEGEQYCVTKCTSKTTTVTIKFESSLELMKTYKIYQKLFRFVYIHVYLILYKIHIHMYIK